MAKKEPEKRMRFAGIRKGLLAVMVASAVISVSGAGAVLSTASWIKQNRELFVASGTKGPWFNAATRLANTEATLANPKAAPEEKKAAVEKTVAMLVRLEQFSLADIFFLPISLFAGWMMGVLLLALVLVPLRKKWEWYQARTWVFALAVTFGWRGILGWCQLRAPSLAYGSWLWAALGLALLAFIRREWIKSQRQAMDKEKGWKHLFFDFRPILSAPAPAPKAESAAAVCPQGHRNPPAAKRCGTCGHHFGDPAAPARRPPAAAPPQAAPPPAAPPAPPAPRRHKRRRA